MMSEPTPSPQPSPASGRGRNLASALLLLLLAPSVRAEPASPAALDVELRRATESLKMEGYPPPYFISLRVTDEIEEQRNFSLGQALESFRGDSRALSTDVRVGSYELDNHPLEPTAETHLVTLPFGEDAYALRHRAWTALDEDYKQAAAAFLRKQAQRVERGKADYETDDLSREPAAVYAAPEPAPAPPDPDLKQVTAAFRGNPSLLYSWATVKSRLRHERLVNSEGTRVETAPRAATLTMSAGSWAPDGIRLNVTRSWTAVGDGSLPSAEKLSSEAGTMQDELAALAKAEPASPLNAPALLDPSASAALFAALATRLEGEEQRNPEGGQTFRSKLGSAITPAFIGLVDDPTVERRAGEPLAGFYRFDDEGVPARRTPLIEKGVLKGFLLSRYPIVGFPRSNGHGRAAPGRRPTARFASLFVESAKTSSVEELKRRLREECRQRGKPFGFWIRHVTRWRQQAGSQEHQAFRALPELVYTIDAETGKETLIRGLDMVGTPLTAVARILAAGNDLETTNYMDDQTSGSVPASTVSGSLLIGEIETQRSEGKPERPPILPAPAP